MRKKWQVFVSVILYITILAWALDFDIFKLFDFKLLLLIILGTAILALPFYEKGMKWPEARYVFGRKAMEAGFIQTFLLLFATLQNPDTIEAMPENLHISIYAHLLSQIALCFRPMLYGFCMFILLSEKCGQPLNKSDIKIGGEKEENEAKPNKQKFDTLQKLKTYGLTKRELEIIQLILNGKSNGEIAADLFISEATVKKHVSNIFEKTGVSRREELIRTILGQEK